LVMTSDQRASPPFWIQSELRLIAKTILDSALRR